MARVYDGRGAGTTRTVTAPVPCTGMPPGPGMPLARLVDVSESVRGTSSRKAKVALLAECLRDLAPGESVAGVAFLAGAPRQRQTGAGWAALRSLPTAADEPALTVGEVDDALERLATLAGPGSRSARLEEVERLFEPRDRAGAGVPRLADPGRPAPGRAGRRHDRGGGPGCRRPDRGRPPRRDARRRPGRRGETALADGAEGLRRIGLRSAARSHRCSPAPRPDVEAALERISPAAIEWKLDGARIQVHRRDGEVRVFTRSLDEVTDRVPEVVDAALALPVALGRPRRRGDRASRRRAAVPVSGDGKPVRKPPQRRRPAAHRAADALFFDVLHIDGGRSRSTVRPTSASRRSRAASPSRCACRARSSTPAPPLPAFSRTRSPAGTRV